MTEYTTMASDNPAVCQTEPMNPEVKAAWLAALRSGEYAQTTQYLHRVSEDGHSYCCLGVLCDIAVKQGLDLSVNTTGVFDSIVQYNGTDGVLPIAVMDWAGIQNEAGRFSDGGFLSAENDEGKTFEEIAAIIEREF